MKAGILKKASLVGLTTLAAGFVLKKSSEAAGWDIPDPALYFALGLWAHIAWQLAGSKKFIFKALGGHAPIQKDDPDLEILLNTEKYVHDDVKKQRIRLLGPKNSWIYGVKLFKPEWCNALIRVSERYGDWHSKSKGGDDSAGMTLPIDFIPELQKQYSEAVKKYVFPCASKLFSTFNPTHHDEVYILRYVSDKPEQNGMKLHYDGEPLACILTLNSGYTGGGTVYPKYKCTIKAEPGVMMLYPGGLSHLHGGSPITSGRRYVLLHALYDKELNGDMTSPWESGEPQHDRDTPVYKG